MQQFNENHTPGSMRYGKSGISYSETIIITFGRYFTNPWKTVESIEKATVG